MNAPQFQLPLPAPRRLLSQTFEADNPRDVKEVLDRLCSEVPNDFRSAFEWFSLFQEASAAISEKHTLFELEVQRNNFDKTAEKKLKAFEENILSQLLLVRQGLMDIYLASPWQASMHPDDFGRIAKDFSQRRRFASPKLAETQIQENQLIRDYRTFINSAETRFFGRTVPVSVIIGKLNDNNGDVRKQAFLSYWSFIQENEDRLQDLFSNLLENRCEQAEAVEAETYIPLAFAELGRIDYGVEECRQFRDAVREAVVPIVKDLSVFQRKALGGTSIAPWDANAWPKLMPSQLPAGGDLKALLEGMQRIAEQIHPSFGKLFQEMRHRNLIDIEPRAGKSPGAFCVTFQESRMPFIFGNFAGNLRDAMTLVHEFGHAIHGYATSSIPNVLLRHPGLEFCEVASMGLEMLAAKHFKEWWPAEKEAKQAWAFQAFHFLNFWPFMAMIDEWQHEVYSKHIFSAKERNAVWLRLSRKYKPQVDWSEAEDLEALGWFSRPHIFTSPFYYIDYGIAQLGAAQIWQESLKSPQKAVESYIRGLSLGAQRSLPELFQATGIRLDFSPEWLRELAALLQKEIRNALD